VRSSFKNRFSTEQFFKIGSRFQNFHRGHDRDQKLIRENHGSIFIFKSDPGFSGKIDPRFNFKNRIVFEKPVPEPHSRRRPAARVQTNLFNFSQPDRGQKPIRINRDPIFMFKSDRNFFVSTGSPFSFFYSGEVSVSTVRFVETVVTVPSPGNDFYRVYFFHRDHNPA
jgi:hypothetical protein